MKTSMKLLFCGIAICCKTCRARVNPVIEVGRAYLSKDVSFFEAENFAFATRELFGSFSMSLSLDPQPSTPFPTPAPTNKFSPEPTSASSTTAPSGESTPSSIVSLSPTTAESTMPPTLTATSGLTTSPTAEASTSGKTNEPTAREPPLLGDGCETSYVFCGEDVSTCFIGGALEAKQGGGPGPWGWSINLTSFDLTGDNVIECDVYAGAGQCDFENKGTLVGSFILSENATAWKFLDGIGGQDFHLYAGTCEGNDAGEHLLNDNVCDAVQVANRARVPGTYSLATDAFDPILPVMTFDSSNQDDVSFRKQTWASENYMVFPLSNPDRQFLSAHATVCPCSAASKGCASPSVVSFKESEPTNFNMSGTDETAKPLTMGAIAFSAVVALTAVSLVAMRRGKKSRSYDSLEEIALDDPDIEV